MSAKLTFSPLQIVGPAGWNQLPLGAGGYITRAKFEATGTRAVIRTDTMGAYVGDSSDGFLWRQLITPASLPSPATNYYGEDNPMGDGVYTDGGGVYDVAIAPSDKTRLYTSWQGYLLRSDNGGVTFPTKTNLPRMKMFANNQIRSISAAKVVVDPVNPDVVYVGGMTTGVWRSMDAGVNWTQVSTVVPNTVDDTKQITALCIDHTSANTGSGATLRKSKVYFGSWFNGFYGSTNGGDSFTQLSSTVTQITDMVCDSVGAIYVCDHQAGLLRRWESGAFTNTGCPLAFPHSVAVDPADNNRVVAIDTDGISTITLNRGTAWNTVRNAGTNNPVDGGWDILSSDILWLSTITGTNPSNIVFRPGVTNELWMGMGVGVMKTNYPDLQPSSNPLSRLQWHSNSAGVEQLVGHYGISPPGGAPILCCWDRALFRITNPYAYPTTFGPDTALRHAAGVDFASDDPKKLASLVLFFGATPQGYSANSVDGGRNWTRMTNQPSTVEGGCIAMNAAGNAVVFPQANGVPKYTLDGGATPWSNIVFPGGGIPSGGSETGFGFGNMAHNRQIATADKMVPLKFSVYNYGPTGRSDLQGLWQTNDGGPTWFQKFSGPIAVNATFHSTLRYVHGQAAHLLLCAGDVGGTNPAPTDFMFSKDDGGSWNALTNVKEVKYFDVGATGLGQTYPPIYFVGYLSGVFSMWRGINFNPITRAITWENLGLPNTVDNAVALVADKNTYGRVILMMSGSGAWIFNG